MATFHVNHIDFVPCDSDNILRARPLSFFKSTIDSAKNLFSFENGLFFSHIKSLNINKNKNINLVCLDLEIL
eukprot:snap_masked-scaffold_49-processed-gene-1.55-mRNA-1 protein AED:1.00 eAED:1.00 QI:0/0/0/0/1/1/3/0/71